MAAKMASKVFFLLVLVCFFSGCSAASKYQLDLLRRAALQSERSGSGLRTYIVHVTKPETFATVDLERFYKSFLSTITKGFSQDERLVYKFTRTGGTSQTYAEGFLKWDSDDGYSVRSPTVVKFD